MIINTDKSCCLHSSKDNKTSYHCGNTALPEALSFKDLGVIRSDDESSALHADYAMAKAQKISSAITKNIKIPIRAIGWMLFLVYVQPVLLYASIAWNNNNNHKLSTMNEKVQRRYTKKLTGFMQHEYTERLNILRVLSSAAMRKYYDLVFEFKVIHKRLPFDPPDFGLQLLNQSRAPLFIQETIYHECALLVSVYQRSGTLCHLTSDQQLLLQNLNN